MTDELRVPQADLCQGTKIDGSPCTAHAQHGSRYCFFHDPEKAEERAEAKSRGGKRRHGRGIGTTGATEPLEIRSLSDVADLVGEEINHIRQLEISTSRARAVGYLAGIAASVFKDTEIEERLAALEAKLGIR